MHRLFVVFLCSALTTICGTALAAKNDLEKEVKEVMSQYDAIGVSVAVIKNNKVIYNKPFGLADNTLKRPTKSYDIYWWASVSKTFISTAIMQLVENENLSLDDNVNNYLNFKVQNPLYPNIPITIRMLLCHRSSLNDKRFDLGYDALIPEKNRDYKLTYNQYAPGFSYHYCNLNYTLLAAIIEKVSSERFDQYIRHHLMEPLGINGSFNRLDLDSSRFVKPYTYNQTNKTFKEFTYYRRYDNESLKDYIMGYSTICFSPAGGMRMTVMDMVRWTMAHMNYGEYGDMRILSKKSELEMWQPQNEDKKYGFAFSQYPNVVKGVNLRGMTGGTCGIHSLMFFEPEKKFGFVVICNGCTSKSVNGAEMNYEIVRVLYKHFIEGNN